MGISRRSFLKGSVGAVAGVSLYSPLASRAWGQVRGANGDIRVVIAGIRGKGDQHIDVFRKIEGVRVVGLCDPDSDLLAERSKRFTDDNESVDTYTDVRRVLDNKDVDAIVIAAPNHWHSLMTIWACQAGKDVYVEKPICHNIFEGLQAIKAARKYNRIVQSGTQNRSDTGMIPAMEYIHAGNIGKMLYVHGLCYRRRKSIGKVSGPQPIPSHIDYDLWTGPAPLGPLMRKSLHYDWHWVFDTGNGDIGNQGPHELDLGVWALGQKELAPRVISVGGRFGYDDDANTANTQLTIYDYKPAPFIFEVRGLATNKNMPDVRDSFMGCRVGVIIKCESGYFVGGRGGGWVYDNDGNKVKQFAGDGGGTHQQNFIDAMRSRKVSDLRADIEQGFLCAGLAHQANISYRLGQTASQDEIKEAFKSNEYAGKRLKSIQDHLFMNWVDLEKTPMTLGVELEYDTKANRFIGEGQYGMARWANDMLTRKYRAPYVVPDRV